MKPLVDLHGNEVEKDGELTHDETMIISEALGLSEKTVEDKTISISEPISIGINAKIDRDLMNLILDKGHSRVPIYYEQPMNIIGLVLVNNLLSIHPTDDLSCILPRNVLSNENPIPSYMIEYDG
jgi:metal transporter CNNM